MVRYFGEQGHKAAIAYLLFILIYAPCVAALAAVYKEIGVQWMWMSFAYLTGLAWIMATMTYQISTFSLHPTSSAAWIAGITAFVLLFIGIMRTIGSRSKSRA